MCIRDRVLHSGLIQYIYITPPVFSFIPVGCRMFSYPRTWTACKLLLTFLICLHPTRVIAIYTETTHFSSLGNGECIIDVATQWQRWPTATTTWWPDPRYICHSSIVLYISRLSNVLAYPHLNSLLGLLAILDTSISYPYNFYLHTYHIPPSLDTGEVL